jgi:hypothetical protein
MSVSSGFAGFAPVAWLPAARFFRVRGVAAGIIAVALAAAVVSPTWAEGPQQAGHPHKKAAATPDLNADGSVPDATAKAGAETKVATLKDCTLPDQPPVASVRADHGTVRIKQGKGPGCGHASVSTVEAFYTSEPGFKGTDKLHILGFTIKSNIDQTLTILVK